MKSGKTNGIILFLLLGLLTAMVVLIMPQTTQAREKSAVFLSIFQNDDRVKIDFCDNAMNEITHLFEQLEYFNVIEKNRSLGFVKELKENNLEMDHYMAIKYGKQLGAHLVVLGTLSDFKYEVTNEIRTNDEGGQTPVKLATAAVTLRLELLNVDQNLLIFSDHRIGQIQDEAARTTTPKNMKMLTEEALHQAVAQFWKPIQNAFPARGLVIKKEKRNGHYCVYVDIGRNWGLTKDKLLSFYHRGEKLVHPVTGQTLDAGKGELYFQKTPCEIFAEYSLFCLSRREYRKMEIGVIVEIDPLDYASERNQE
ncbi:hypothetical protein JXQ70_12170 [bacterium]|nr:hypothetical protein [bacterium]